MADKGTHAYRRILIVAALIAVWGAVLLLVDRGPVRPASPPVKAQKFGAAISHAKHEPDISFRRVLAAAVDRRQTPAMLAMALRSAAKTDPGALLAVAEYAARTGYPDLGELLDACVGLLVESGQSDSAQHFVEVWLEGPYKAVLGNGAVESAAAAVARTSRTAALAWLTALPACPARTQALAGQSAEWAATEPQAAIAWATTLPDDATRIVAMERAFNRWSNSDSIQAATWLAQHADAPSADRLILDFIDDSTNIKADPKLAAAWAEGLSDPQLREKTLGLIFMRWERHDPGGAAAFAETEPFLSDSEQAKVNARPRG